MITNDYTGTSIMGQKLSDARARNESLANSVSNMDTIMNIRNRFESEAAVPTEMQMAQHTSDVFNAESKEEEARDNRNS
jgi:hypothetical protein